MTEPPASTPEEETAALLASFEEDLGYRFHDRSLLENALRHASHSHEHPELESNERLEFLGDAVIGLVVGHRLFVAHPDWEEGDLTRALHALVDKGALAALARRLGLGPVLALGRTEQQSGGAEKTSILGDAMEAVIGAIYLDGGLDPVGALADRAFAEAFSEDAPRVHRDPKTALQEAVMASGAGELPLYTLESDSEQEGDEQRFTVAVHVGGRIAGRGIGRSKRAAEREAAAAALAQSERDGTGLDGS